MGTPSTTTVRRIVTFGREELVSKEEWVTLLDTRRDQILPLMKWMDTVSLLDIKLHGFLSQELEIRGARIKCSDRTFKPAERCLYFHHFIGSAAGAQIYWYWGLTPKGRWVKFGAYVVFKDHNLVIEKVEVEVFETQDFVEKHFPSRVWIDLSRAIDQWVERRRELLEKAEEIQEEFLKQDAMIAPFMRQVGDGIAQRFVQEKS